MSRVSENERAEQRRIELNLNLQRTLDINKQASFQIALKNSTENKIHRDLRKQQAYSGPPNRALPLGIATLTKKNSLTQHSLVNPEQTKSIKKRIHRESHSSDPGESEKAQKESQALIGEDAVTRRQKSDGQQSFQGDNHLSQFTHSPSLACSALNTRTMVADKLTHLIEIMTTKVELAFGKGLATLRMELGEQFGGGFINAELRANRTLSLEFSGIDKNLASELKKRGNELVYRLQQKGRVLEKMSFG